jgi:p-hydroxybenzoate 3-monooxygenase
MADQTAVVIVGAGPAGLVLGNLLRANGIDTLILERGSRAHVETRARAGFLGAHSARVLTGNGLAAGMLRDGHEHDTCTFRQPMAEFELNYRHLGRGEVHTVYPQQNLVTDLIAEYLDRGGELRFDVTVTVTDVDAETATIRYQDGSGSGEATGRFLAGCDGSNGVTRSAIPTALVTRHARDHGVGWLAIIAEAPPSSTAVTYAMHDNGFAGHMARSPQVTRYYLQVPPDKDPAGWSDERIWTELGVRMGVDRFGPLRQGPVTERRVVRSRSDVIDPIQYGRLFLVGDAASLIGPSAAKGANLAILEAEILAGALADALTQGDEQALAGYSRMCLPRIWRAQEFSHWMINLLHGPRATEPDAGFHWELRRARLDSLRDSRAHQDFFAENYVGI